MTDTQNADTGHVGTGNASPQNIVVIGASAGGIEPLLRLAAQLPADLAAAVCVVVHIPDNARGALPYLLERSGPLPARYAEHGDALVHGQWRHRGRPRPR